MRLSIFQGGITRQAAFSVTGTSLALLSSLVDKSLLRYNKNPERYELHELIRQYAHGMLLADPLEEQQTSEKYALHFAGWLAALEAPFKSARQQEIAHLIRSETFNWQGSWAWAIEHQRLDVLRKMSACLNWYLEVHGYYEEALSVFQTAVRAFRIRGAPVTLRTQEEKATFALLVDSVGWFHFRTGNVQLATSLLAESLEIAHETGDPEVLYYIHGNSGYLCLLTGEIAEAGRLTTESLRYGWSLTPWHTAIPVSVLGIVAYQQGNLKEAFRQLADSLAIWRMVGDPRGLVFCMLYLGMTALALNDTATTRSVIQESNTIAEAKMDRWAHAFGLDLLGMVCLAEGQEQEALHYFQHSLEHYRQIGDTLNSTQTLIHLGQAHVALKCPADARPLYLEAYANARQAGWTLIILVALVSFAEMEKDLSPEMKLAIALSVLAHPSVTPNLRARSERIRDELQSQLPPEQIKAAEELAKERTAEAWAEEIIR